ncbi:hypothetical protein MTP99_004991 [Tenebrio molitor]|nr:hypothetical protein MTP99_004991 [Tenebrio molitor]
MTVTWPPTVTNHDDTPPAAMTTSCTRSRRIGAAGSSLVPAGAQRGNGTADEIDEVWRGRGGGSTGSRRDGDSGLI